MVPRRPFPGTGRWGTCRSPPRSPETYATSRQYLTELDKRHQWEAEVLAELTGWDLGTTTKKMGDDSPGKKAGGKKDAEPWYKRLWK